MARKRKPTSKALTAAAVDSEMEAHHLPVVLSNGKTEDRVMAEHACGHDAPAAVMVRMFGHGTFGELSLKDSQAVIRDTAARASAGDLSDMERMLAAQAITLNTIFLEMGRRCSINMGEHLNAAETYMRLALKAQAQSRSTIEALAEIKQPRQAVFAKQANIANNQQINNGEAQTVARTEESNSPQTKLLEGTNVIRLDAGASRAPGRGYPTLEAVAEVHRAKVARRQGAG